MTIQFFLSTCLGAIDSKLLEAWQIINPIDGGCNKKKKAVKLKQIGRATQSHKSCSNPYSIG